MKQFICTALIVGLFAHFLVAQNNQKKELFRIVKTDTAGYPIVKTSIEMVTKVQPIKGDFVVQDATGKPVDIITFENKKSEGEGKIAAASRLIYFLLDASSYTSGQPLNSIKGAVKESFIRLNKESDLINVGYFGHNNQLKHLERDFTSNYDNFQSDINSIVAFNDTTNALPDANKAMYDAIDFFRRSRKDGQKILIVVSAGLNKDKTAYKRENVIERAKKMGVNIYTINFEFDKIANQFNADDFRIISDKTDAESKNVSSSTEIKNALGDFLEGARSAAPKEENTLRYEISFQVPDVRDGKEYSFKIIYNGQEQIGYFTAPNGAGEGGFLNLNNVYWLIAIVVLGLLIGVGYWQYNQYQLRKLEEEEAAAEQEQIRIAEEKRREQEHQAKLQQIQEQNIRLQEQLRMKEQELARKIDEVPTVIPPSKIDPKKTMIGGGGAAPVLQVVAGAFSKNYRLNKPTLTVGRAANNDIIIPEQTVSSHHCTITIENGNFFLTDNESTNGTFVNGSRIDKKMLKAGDLIKLGGASCKFEIV
jgi:Mg-chelatase subunit ChlD